MKHFAHLIAKGLPIQSCSIAAEVGPIQSRFLSHQDHWTMSLYLQGFPWHFFSCFLSFAPTTWDLGGYPFPVIPVTWDV